jgi:hypothetical protein
VGDGRPGPDLHQHGLPHDLRLRARHRRRSLAHGVGLLRRRDYTPVVYGNRLWPLGDNPAICDTATGTQVGTAAFEGAIGVAGGAAYVPMNGALLGVDAGTWATRWTFGASGVDNEAPLIGDTHVYARTGEGAVLALDRGTGAPAWCAGVFNSTTIDEHKDSHMGAGDGRLFVPSGTYLVAYRALKAGLTSGEITVYSGLAYRFKTRNLRGGRFRQTVTLTGPRTPRLTAKRLHLDLIKDGSRSARLAASPRITGRYRATATLRYLRPRAKTIVIACNRETKPDAWGATTDLDKACGRRRLRFTKPARR